MIYAAVSLGLFSDGLLIGADSSLSFELALVLAIGQVTVLAFVVGLLLVAAPGNHR